MPGNVSKLIGPSKWYGSFPCSFLFGPCNKERCSKRSLHFPRAAVVADNELLFLLTWALTNLAATLGLVPALWWRELTPIRKEGPEVVNDPAKLRPIGYTDELAGVFDALWLRQARPFLEQFMGKEQAGGRLDSTLIAVGVLIAIQLRRNLELPTFLEKVDLLQGFDLAWRDGIRSCLVEAGLTGRLWLAADAALETDRVRVRVGPLVGSLVELTEFGIGQGKRAAVHLFGRPCQFVTYADEHEDQSTSSSCEPSRLATFLSRCHSEEEMARHLGKLSFADRMSVLDCSAQHRILLTQFVDDAFVFHSSLAGLLKGNRALESFAESWKHMFKGGKKRAAVLAVGAATPAAEALGTLQGERVRPAQAITVLGPTLDTALSLSPQLELVCCRVQTLSQQLGAALWGLGFGMPQLVAQFSSRVEPAVLHGAEILASHVLGFPYVCKRINQAQYQAFKALLSAGRDFSLGASGQAKLFASLGVQLRLGTRLGMRICMTRARLLSLQSGHPVEAALEAAPAVTGATWLDHARLIEAEFSVAPGWEVFANAHPAPHSAKEAKRLQAKWKLSVPGPQ